MVPPDTQISPLSSSSTKITSVILFIDGLLTNVSVPSIVSPIKRPNTPEPSPNNTKPESGLLDLSRFGHEIISLPVSWRSNTDNCFCELKNKAFVS